MRLRQKRDYMELRLKNYKAWNSFSQFTVIIQSKNFCQVTEDREPTNRHKTSLGVGNSLSVNHTEFAMPREYPGGYNQEKEKYKMPEFLACYQKRQAIHVKVKGIVYKEEGKEETKAEMSENSTIRS